MTTLELRLVWLLEDDEPMVAFVLVDVPLERAIVDKVVLVAILVELDVEELDLMVIVITVDAGFVAHTNCVCPISQAPLILNDSKTMALTASRLAPENALNGTVTVCVAPVIPVTVVKELVYAVVAHDVEVCSSSVKLAPAGPLTENVIAL